MPNRKIVSTKKPARFKITPYDPQTDTYALQIKDDVSAESLTGLSEEDLWVLREELHDFFIFGPEKSEDENGRTRP